MKRNFIAIILGSVLLFLQACYPVGDGAVYFDACQDCYPPYDTYLYVDGNYTGFTFLANYYDPTGCAPDCEKGKDAFSLIGGNSEIQIDLPAGDHIYTLKNSLDTLVGSGSFTISKQKCTFIHVHMKGGLGPGC